MGCSLHHVLRYSPFSSHTTDLGEAAGEIAEGGSTSNGWISRSKPACSATICDAAITIRLTPMPNLRRRASAVKLLSMKRQLFAVIVMLAIGLQSSVVAIAGISPLMSTDCQTTAVSHSNASQDSCCPQGQHTMGCCLEACVATVAGAVTTTPQTLNWLGSVALVPQFLSTRYFSRGDSPLIRPPIL